MFFPLKNPEIHSRVKKRQLKEMYCQSGDKFLSIDKFITIYHHLEPNSKNSDIGAGRLQPVSTLFLKVRALSI